MADRPGVEVEIESEAEGFGAYLSVPSSGRGPGVLVLQEWWGLVPQIRDVCDRLARSGFVALAPDLYRGASTADPNEAAQLMMELEVERAGRDLGAAVEALRRRPETDGVGVGVIGFCMGGQLALHAAALCPEVSAVIDCYGVHPRVRPDWAAIRAKVLGVFAEDDEFVSAADVASLSTALDEAGVDAQIRVFPRVGHAFMNESRPDAYDASVAALAWREVENFFAAELRDAEG